jgi:photosystem II stability/assembly factor-like uncharacterized protein
MRQIAVCLGLLAVCSLPLLAYGSSVSDPLDQPASQTQTAASKVLMGVAKAGDRLVAVGERGIIVLSDDHGKTWRQAAVPTSVTLTAVDFPVPNQGWVVGHSGVVLHTSDSGETWTRQLDGKAAAQLMLAAAQARANRGAATNAVEQKQLAQAQRFVEEGADKPFLDVHFENELVGFVVGAFGLIFRTDDGGKSWQDWTDRVDDPHGFHLYSIKSNGRTIYLAGEQGLFLRSTDAGNSFKRIETPYRGSYFTAALTPSGAILLAGMRGNAYRSTDQGKSFTKVDVPIAVSFSDALLLKNGNLLFVNQAGNLLESRDDGRTMHVVATPPMPPVAAITQA